MYRVGLSIIFSFLCLVILAVGNVHAAWDKPLVTINGHEYTAEDYRGWWKIWQEPGMKFFDSPQEFIDFHLLAEQGRQMEYDLNPGFQRKALVFLKVRALAGLKYEEADSKINVSEEDIRDYFEKNHSPSWAIQILSYDDPVKAGEAYKKLKEFNGQKAGRLVFADFAGIRPEEGGPIAFEEVSLTPAKIKANDKNGDKWLEVISNLKNGFVSEPFLLEGQGRHVIIRLADTTFPGEDVFKARYREIEYDLVGRARSDLSQKLIAKLKEKYHLRIDQELLQSLKSDGEYPEDLLAKPVAQIDGSALSAGMLLYNVKRQGAYRQKLSEDVLKSLVVENYVSNILLDTEALNRHYERKQPLKGQYEFYIDNSLRKFLDSDIRKRVVVTDSEVRDYFDNNLAAFTRPEKIAYLLIEENLTLLNEISGAVLSGASFFDQAAEHYFDIQIKTTEVKALEPELVEELAKLSKGETGRPFAYGNGYAMVHLVDRIEPETIPFAEVEDGIRKTVLEEKYLKDRQAYLDKVRSVADVKINQSTWNKLKKEYENAKGN